jgi:GNAT superfamily N-acetyltransferase
VRASSRPTFPHRYSIAPDTVCGHPHRMHIDVVPFGDTDETAALCAYEIRGAGWRVMTPDFPYESTAHFLSGIRLPAPGSAVEHALAYLDGTPAGYLYLDLPLLDNLDNAEAELWVAPAYRRRGVGHALWTHAAGRIRALGRKRITAESVESEEATGFAAAVGAGAALRETRSRLDIATIDQQRLKDMLAEAWTRADGYRLVRWQGVPPDRYIDDVAYLDSRFLTDAPTGDLEWEPENVDADRICKTEQWWTERGADRFHAGMVHEASDRLVAWTTLSGPADTAWHLWQHITLVDPPHRGHRLGTIVKVANLAHAQDRRPQLAAIDTWNAMSNEYMLAINRAMGFRAVDTWVEWQRTV